jgi:hypothetical protein
MSEITSNYGLRLYGKMILVIDSSEGIEETFDVEANEAGGQTQKKS